MIQSLLTSFYALPDWLAFVIATAVFIILCACMLVSLLVSVYFFTKAINRGLQPDSKLESRILKP